MGQVNLGICLVRCVRIAIGSVLRTARAPGGHNSEDQLNKAERIMTLAEPAANWMMRQKEGPAEPLSESAMEALVAEGRESVRFLASRLSSRLPAHVDVEDLYQFGMIGLLQSAQRYDGSRGIKFNTYASQRVLG